MTGTKILTDRPVHVRAVKLSRDGWRVVLSLPEVCETLDEPCPEWAWCLCEHAMAVADGAPEALLEALPRGEGDGVLLDSNLVELGKALDLCVVVRPADDGAVQITPTAFGYVVCKLHHQCVSDGDAEGPL